MGDRLDVGLLLYFSAFLSFGNFLQSVIDAAEFFIVPANCFLQSVIDAAEFFIVPANCVVMANASSS
jgi:hypothetical protein